VVGVEVPGVGALTEAAAAVAAHQYPSHGGGDDAGGGADADGDTGSVLDDDLDAGVAEQPAGGLGGEGLAGFEFGGGGGVVVADRGEFDDGDDGGAVGVGVGGEVGCGEGGEPVGAPLVGGGACVGVGVAFGYGPLDGGEQAGAFVGG